MLTNYLKIALRTLWQNRLFTAINMLGLIVGVAGGLLIYLFLRHHLSTDRHHVHYERIVRISTDLHLDDGTVEHNPEAPPPMAQALRTRYPQVEQAGFLAGFSDMNVSFRRPGSSQVFRFLEHTGVGFAEPEWLDVLTYTFLYGHPQKALRAPNQAILTESWAKRYFGSTAGAFGQTVTLNHKAVVTVVGIVADPPGPTDTEQGLLVSLSTINQVGVGQGMTNDWYSLNSTNRVYARLKNPETLPHLQQAMPALTKREYGKSARFFRFVVQPLSELHFDVARDPAHSIRPSLLWSIGAIGVLIILAACINFVNLATAQAVGRGKEVGVRKALGSSKRQVAGQFFIETGLISFVATGMAVLLVVALLPHFNEWLQLQLSLSADRLTVGIVAGIFISITFLSGAYPAGILSGFSPWEALRGKLSTPTGSLSARKALVIGQFAVCQLLLLSALVVARQVQYLQQADLGYKKENVLLVSLPFDQAARHSAFKQTLANSADVRSVSLSALPPSSSSMFGGQIKFNGRADWEKFAIRDRLADADYLRTYNLHLLAGRNITPGDTIWEFVINETLLHKLGYQNPEQVLGKRIWHYLVPAWLPVVGVVKDFNLKSLRDEVAPCIIANWSPWYRWAGVRITGQDPTQTIQHIRQIYQQIFPDEVFEYQFLDDQVASFYETERLITRLVNTFTLLAVLICCLGLYGLVLHMVQQRTKEIGVRKVLGASVLSLVILLNKDFLKLVVVAIVVASPVAWYLMQSWLENYTYRVQIEWWGLALSGLLSVSIALLTVSYQSIRAALMNPAKSLRTE
ncbi:FtsX-like permease family protein [Rudanella paleaurantiibacter]|uniref:FtsX-like permease family protein n=1 Tax=Rudanella paleaurantiibacter TaxID=2614655 RepID=A0A7J5U4T6_9BACT|nr:FtsX-like permease family protein [Rudanella paleaurantiibacter]KAB7732852.1 FtsX-like permease family protein [Rudanella paleaurantiibacter]